jgi:hypothetical protein
MGIPLDGLIVNACIMALQKLEQVPVKSSSGNDTLLEKQFGVNHLGYFVIGTDPLVAESRREIGRRRWEWWSQRRYP